MSNADFIGTFTVTEEAVTPIQRAGGNRGNRCFQVLGQFGDNPLPLITVQDKAQTYTLPDLDAVRAVLRGGGLRARPFLMALKKYAGSEPQPDPDPTAEVTKADGEEGDPAALKLGGIWQEGDYFTLTLTLRNEEGEEDVRPVVLEAPSRITAAQGATVLAQLVDQIVLYHAEADGNMVYIEPESDSYTVKIMASPVTRG